MYVSSFTRLSDILLLLQEYLSKPPSATATLDFDFSIAQLLSCKAVPPPPLPMLLGGPRELLVDPILTKERTNAMKDKAAAKLLGPPAAVVHDVELCDVEEGDFVVALAPGADIATAFTLLLGLPGSRRSPPLEFLQVVAIDSPKVR